MAMRCAGWGRLPLSCTTTMRNGWCTSIPILIAPVAGFPRVRTTQSLQTSRELPVERIIRHLEARGQLIDLSTVQLEQLQDGHRCDPLGAIHPLVRGANTSQFRGDEVEIARIQLESTPERCHQYFSQNRSRPDPLLHCRRVQHRVRSLATFKHESPQFS